MVRRSIKDEIVLTGEDNEQQLLGFIEADRRAGKEITDYEYAVLVTNTDYEILSFGQLYRDRADAENVFDELKNQWGWGGFTTHDLHRCQLAARATYLNRRRMEYSGMNWTNGRSSSIKGDMT